MIHARRILFATVGLIAWCAAPVSAQLPQSQNYQVVLRNYLASFTEADFALDLQPVGYDDAYFASLDDLHRMWILMEDRGRKMPANTGLRVAPALFTLASIERSGAVYMQVGRNSNFFDPIDAAWWVTWDYPGNPYYLNQAGINRVIAASAVDLIMTANNLATSTANRRSDYIGGYITRLAYAYYRIKPYLPADVRTAYEEGLRLIFNELIVHYPSGSGGADMETFQLVGMWYAAEAIDDDVMRDQALRQARFVLEAIMKGDGHFHQHGKDGIDLSYEGIAQRFMSWAALLYRDATISGFLDKSARLKAYQTLPEPEGRFNSPSHFNTGTIWGSATDQWFTYHRDHAVAMTTDEAKYLVWTGRALGSTYTQGLPDENQMRSDIALAISQRNADADGAQGWAWNAPSAATPAVWAPQHWLNGIVESADYYPPGFYEELAGLAATDSPLMRPPMLRDTPFIETFGDDFVIARFPGYGAIIHTGTTVAAWATGIPGLSGGALSAFWTPDGGSAILGRSRGAQNTINDQWTGDRGWQTWAVHAISGTSESGLPFSTARNRFPTVTRTVDGTTGAVVVVNGAIGAHDQGRSAPDGAIAGQVSYTRTFTLSPAGLTVTSSLASDGTDRVSALWEMLPLYLGDVNQTEGDARIESRVGNAWVATSTTTQTGVTALRTVRYGQSVQITFDTPRRVRLAPTVWTSTAIGSRIQNVMIDLLDSPGLSAPMPAQTSVTYTIAPASDTVPGDASGNGIVSALDAALVLEHVAGQRILTGASFIAADVTGNGLVTPLDASYILQRVVGLIDCLPIDLLCQAGGKR
ncbi:MAG: dockerin type I repeat-containing protein [Rhodothermales bacterium]